MLPGLRSSIPDRKRKTTSKLDDQFYGGKFVSYAPAAFTPKKYPWYSFLLEAESTLGT